MSSITEQRFLDNTGERYCKTGTVRCHALSAARVRAIRARLNDYESPSDKFWPEAQCPHAAIIGTFCCKFHGAAFRGMKPKDLLDVLPVDLAEKLKIVKENPSYISRHEDIQLLLARKAQILERLNDEEGGETSMMLVEGAVQALRRGKTTEALGLMVSALDQGRNEQEIWNESYKIDEILKDLTNTQTRLIKEMRLMATVEQVHSLIDGVYHLLLNAADVYVEPKRRGDFLTYTVGRLQQLTNSGARSLNLQLTDGSGEESGDSSGLDQ